MQRRPLPPPAEGGTPPAPQHHHAPSGAPVTSDMILKTMDAVGSSVLPIDIVPLPQSRPLRPGQRPDGCAAEPTPADAAGQLQLRGCDTLLGGIPEVGTLGNLLESVASRLHAMLGDLLEQPLLVDPEYDPPSHMRVFKFTPLHRLAVAMHAQARECETACSQAQPLLASLLQALTERHDSQARRMQAEHDETKRALEDLQERLDSERKHLRGVCEYKVKHAEQLCEERLEVGNREIQAKYITSQKEIVALKGAAAACEVKHAQEVSQLRAEMQGLRDTIQKLTSQVHAREADLTCRESELRSQFSDQLTHASRQFNDDRDQLVDMLEQLSFVGEETQHRSILVEEEKAGFETMKRYVEVSSSELLKELEKQQVTLVTLEEHVDLLSAALTNANSENIALREGVASLHGSHTSALQASAAQKWLSEAGVLRVYYLKLQLHRREQHTMQLRSQLSEVASAAEAELCGVRARHDDHLRRLEEQRALQEEIMREEAESVKTFFWGQQQELQQQQHSPRAGRRSDPPQLLPIAPPRGSVPSDPRRLSACLGNAGDALAGGGGGGEHPATPTGIARQVHLQGRELASAYAEFSGLARKRFSGFAGFSVSDLCNAQENALLRVLAYAPRAGGAGGGSPDRSDWDALRKNTPQLPMCFLLLHITVNFLKAINKVLFLQRSALLMARKVFATLLCDKSRARKLSRRLRDKRLSPKLKAALRAYRGYLDEKRASLTQVRGDAVASLRGTGRFSTDRLLVEMHTSLAHYRKSGLQHDLAIAKVVAQEAVSVISTRKLLGAGVPFRTVAAAKHSSPHYNPWASNAQDPWALRHGVSSIASFDIPQRTLPHVDGSLWRRCVPGVGGAIHPPDACHGLAGSDSLGLAAANVLRPDPLLGCPAESIPRRAMHSAALPTRAAPAYA